MNGYQNSSPYFLPQVQDGTLYVNGQPQKELFIKEKPGYVLDKLTVPPGDVSAQCLPFMRALFTACVHTMVREEC